MKPLTIELSKGSKKQFQCIGWKAPKAGECRMQCFALDESGKRLILTLKPAMSDWYLPGKKPVFSREPFPEAVCIEILQCRLLPPPCFQSREDFESRFPLNAYNTSDAVDQVLIPKPSDDGSLLQNKLTNFQTAVRIAYERERDAWLAQIAELKSANTAELKPEAKAEHSKRIEEAEMQLAIVESENPIEGVACKGHLRLTLEGVKQGHAGIRDAYLHEEWAIKNGMDLAAMAGERWAFFNWLEAHTGTPANIINLTRGRRGPGISPPGFGDHYERNPQFLAACAKVRFRAAFEDSGQSAVYLEHCEVRGELDSIRA